MKSLVRSGLALTGAAVLGATLAVGGVSAMGGNPGHGNGNGNGKPARAAEIYQDEIKDYGVCRGLDASCYNDWGNGFDEGEDKRILIWSRTAGPRHDHLGTPLGEGMNPELAEDNVAQRELIAWAEERGIEADWTEDLDEFRRLGGYQAVVFLSANRDTLGDQQQNELTKYMRGGGGFVGIHNAFGAEYNWEWYEGLLGGANFYDHGPNRAGTVETIDDEDVSTEFLPDEFAFTDEFYNLYPYPSYVNVLLEASEDTVALDRDGGHPGHGDAHPLSWNHYYDGGRAWLTTLGHEVDAWTGESENSDLFEEHVMNGVESAMGVSEFLGD